jgi:phage tail sheath protein FI
MPTYKTPAVYVQEKSVLPPSVAEVPTAIPAFIGYTEKVADSTGESIINVPTRVTSMIDYITAFGGPYLETATVVDYVTSSGEFVVNTSQPKLAKFFLYHAVSHFFSNGGGKCYVISIGAGYNTVAKSKTHFMSAIDCLKKVDEVTLIITPESVNLTNQGHYDVHNKSLAHSTLMGDRFSLIDCIETGDIVADAELLRNKVVGTLKYGAAYYPNLVTSMARTYNEDLTEVNYQCTMLKIHDSYKAFCTADGRLTDEYGYLLNEALEVEEGDTTVYQTFLKISDDTFVDSKGFKVDIKGKRAGGGSYGIFTDVSGTQFLNILGRETDANSNEEKTSQRYEIAREDKTCKSSLAYLNKANGRLSSNAIYNQVKALLNTNYLILPPCSAVAGIIAITDGTKGVWQAPANLALSMTVAPNTDIDHFEQEDLNVDVIAGKSINAIRSFVGKGTLIWGARTLAGNDNEWRYIPVRRLFNMIEETIQKGTAFAVFEPNTPFTWLKISSMISNYLESLWKQGALFGGSAGDSFFVNVGLGQTMTENDILNGRMNVEIGIAAVRPAEFIILTFSHKSLA